MSGINKVILIGNLGSNPEYKPEKGVCTVSLATSESWKDKATGQSEERTEWHKLVFFKKLAEIVAEYLKKGSKIYVEGKLKTSKYTDKEGVERYTTQIIFDNMQMLGGKEEGASAVSKKEDQPYDKTKADTTFFDDDIPF